MCHEIGHAFAAYRGGDDTALRQGRISLNPLVHLDPIGTVVIPILQFFVGIPLIGWAKPVPVNPARLRSSKWMLAVSLAGVTVNLVLALVAAGILKLLLLLAPDFFAGGGEKEFSLSTAIQLLLVFFVLINLALMLFNLVPIPPLDGSRVVFHFIRSRDSAAFRVFEFLEHFGFPILLVLVLTGGFGFIFGPILGFMLRAVAFAYRIPLLDEIGRQIS
jgi:Zn-dependent protease